MPPPDPPPELLARFLDRPDRSAIISDFDGTLAPIVADPRRACALPGAVSVLHRLARKYARVAVVSGRPVSFLVDQLKGDDPDSSDGLVVSGLYGLERAVGPEVEQHPDALPWAPVVEEAAAAADREAPAGVGVERKGFSVTLHVREAAHHDRWAADWAAARAEATGLVVHSARLSYELRPPVAIDKGTVVADLIEGLAAACFIGDDRGDLPAFDALDRAEAAGAAVLRVGVFSPEAPAELLERADVEVDGPPGALDLLRRLLG